MEKPPTDLQKLRELTEKLVSLPSLCTKVSNSTLDIISAEGNCRLDSLYSEEGKASIVLATATAGAVIESHAHTETEHLIMISGEMIVYSGNQIIVLHAGGHIMLLPGTPHKAEFTKDTLLFGITIPNTSDYPHLETHDDRTGV